MNDFCLNNNILIPNIGFGTWHIKDCAILEESIVSAIRLGSSLSGISLTL